jgi:hypothetical protein
MNQTELSINVGGVDVTVSGYYSPEEPMVRYYSDGSGYPGCAAEFELQSVQVDGTEIINLISDEIFEEIVEKAIEHLKD